MNGSITVPPCNFAIYTPVINDFSIGLTNVSMVRIRSIAKYSITYTNFGNDDSTGQIKFVKDPFVNFGTQTISNQIIGDTLLYQFAPLASGQSRTFAIYIDIPNNQTLIGKSLCVNAFINTNKLDLNRSNNSVQSCAVVNYPLDPNYKTVFPSGTTPNGFISAADSILTYTINFQNTGTDTAYNVIITDSISPLLNVGSIEVIASSHPQNLTISGQGLATFTFNSIMLPDSNINEEGSHGFVQYTIRLNKGLPIGSVINNFASIYFDLNAPVVTNQTVSTLSSLVNQTMNFPSIQDVPFDHLPIHLNANATSGLAINTIVSGPVTLAGDSLLINGEGQVRVRTYQQGDGIYTAAKYIDRVFKIHPAPVASISSPSSSAICASKPVNFSVLLAKGTPPFSFKLSNGTDVFDFTNQPLNSIVSVTPTTSGAFQLLNVVDSTQAGPQGPFGSEQVTVNSLPTLVITQPSPVCNTSTVDITASSITSGSNPGLTYSYWRNATATIVEPNANSINSTSTVYIKGVNASGCSEIKQVSVTINPTPSLLISNPAAVCSPATVDITATAVTTGSSSGLTYSYWQDPAATIVKSSVSTLNNSGIVYIKGSNGLGCFSIKPVNVTIYQLPSATLSNPTFDSIEVGEATEFTVTLYSGTNPFSCTLSNGTDIFTFTGQTSPALLSVNPTVSGVFQVVNLTDNNACAMLGSFGAQTVTLKPITSTIDGLGKEEIFEIYPNPSQGNFEIRIVQKNADLANGEISIYNSTGILIDTRKIEYQNFYTTNLGKGIYFVSIGNSGKRVTKKLVID